jgi:hypothetical protein
LEKVGQNPMPVRIIAISVWQNLLSKTCVNRIMEQGFEKYRRDRLESAVRKWKVVLLISPGHQEAKKSIDTATVQLHALQNMKNK